MGKDIGISGSGAYYAGIRLAGKDDYGGELPQPKRIKPKRAGKKKPRKAVTPTEKRKQA